MKKASHDVGDVLYTMRKTLFMRTYKKHKEEVAKELEEKKSMSDLRACAPSYEILNRTHGAPRPGGPRWNQAESLDKERSMIERGRPAMEVRTTRQEPMASTSKS